MLLHIAHAETFVAAPIAMIADGVVRRELVHRFPYVIVFVETARPSCCDDHACTDVIATTEFRVLVMFRGAFGPDAISAPGS